MNYIVGAGITAIAAYKIFPNSIVIAPERGVLPKTFFIWKDEHTKRFLEENNLKYETKTFTVGRLGNNVSLYNEITNKKSVNAPCEGRDKFEGYLLLEKLVPPPLARDTIRHVGSGCLSGVDRKYFDVDKIIWTAPVDNTTFFGKKYSVKYKAITFLDFKPDKELFDEDFLYLLEEKFLNAGIYRAVKNSDKYSFEINKFLYPKERLNCIEMICDHFKFSVSKFYECSTIHRARVIAKEHPKDINNLYFVGRYSQANYEIKLNDCLEKLYKIKDGLL